MCGVVGIVGSPEAAKEAFLGLTTLQHRGQDAAGILTYDTTGFHRVKNLGLVESVFNRENMAGLTGSMALGHARYSTIGRGDLVDVQPFLISYPFGIGMVHNGNIVNTAELAEDLKQRAKRHLLTQSDTEVVLNLFAEGLVRSLPAQGNGSPDGFFAQVCEAVQGIVDRVNGSYSIITLVAEQGLVAFRDPHGIRPLVLGKREGKRVAGEPKDSKVATILASESVALSFLGYEFVRDVAPGEVIWISPDGTIRTRVLAPKVSPPKEKRPCMFEWVYFASPESVMDGAAVYGARIQLGKNLARIVKERMAEGRMRPDVVVPVPETSRIAAIALAEELGIPYRETLIKNRYIKRTFILDSQEKRQSAVNLKLSPVCSEIKGKRILLVDDSIVRGTTSKKIVELVRKAGALEVYFVSTCPPIRLPCYYGIDFPLESELIASGRDLSAIEKTLGADAVVYQSLEGLQTSISPSLKPCMACLDGAYPTSVQAAGGGFGQTRAQDRASDRKKGEDL